jgi:autotransporter strand-loop-strand O-heptosyltransferase
MGAQLIPLFRAAYPDINFVPLGHADPEKYYATYHVGLFRNDDDCTHRPCDYRLVGLHEIAAHILGVDPAEAPPRIVLEDDSRPISEPYVCIGVQATGRAKMWNNPTGWREVVAFLKEAGYRVICIDREPSELDHGAEDETGDRPLLERARWLKHAEFFVGLSSGLSWLAWVCGVPVVLISGFTAPHNEFTTPYRVINHHCCHSCWHDQRHRFDPEDFLYCPRHAGSERMFECTRGIAPTQVIRTIRTIPAFGRQAAARNKS